MSIQVQAVQRAHKTVLDNLNLTIKPNTIYGLLGRNGAGKSTLLNIISNRIFADSGTVTMDNESMCDNDRTLGKVYLMSEVNLLFERVPVKQLFKTTHYSMVILMTLMLKN